MRQHGGMGEGAGNILLPHHLIKADGGIDGLHDLRRATGKPPAPLDIGVFLVFRFRAVLAVQRHFRP